MKRLTVTELNTVQAEWMALQSDAPKAEKDRVFKLMESFPKCHLSISEDRKIASVTIDGGPVWAYPRSIGAAQRWLVEYGLASGRRDVRTDVGWCGSIGKWVEVASV